VHEWGLVVTEASGALAIATGSPQAPTPEQRPVLPNGREGIAAPAKPVFYVHLDDGLDEARFTLGVRSVSRGRVIEHFPIAVRQERNTAIVWEDVIARRGSCQGVYPGLADPLCATPDGLCELAELSDYETREAACLSFGEQRVGLLFYRMDGARDTLPIDVRRGAADTVRLRSVGAPPGGSGHAHPPRPHLLHDPRAYRHAGRRWARRDPGSRPSEWALARDHGPHAAVGGARWCGPHRTGARRLPACLACPSLRRG
jgi:hypothetical protein